jgi:hypothetical protein
MRAKARWPSSNLLIVLALVSHGQRKLHQTNLAPASAAAIAGIGNDEVDSSHYPRQLLAKIRQYLS